MPYDPKDELPAKHYSKKDTKRWCKGKVGVEHELAWQQKQYFKVKACVNCGRHFDWEFPGIWQELFKAAKKISPDVVICVADEDGNVREL